MNEEKILSDKNITKTNNNGVTSPISANRLVSKVNSLTYGNRSNSLTNPQTKTYATEKGKTLEYKNIIDELIKLYPVNNIYEFYSKYTALYFKTLIQDSLQLVYIRKNQIV